MARRSSSSNYGSNRSGHRTGRAKEEWPPVPTYRDYQVQAIADWMQTHRENRRPLKVAAPVLAIVCALHERGHPFPTRARVAEAIGDCTKDVVDAALSTALGFGEISERWETMEGAVQQRRSVRRVRFLEPSPKLLDVYRAAKASQLEPVLNLVIKAGRSPEKAERVLWAILDGIKADNLPDALTKVGVSAEKAVKAHDRIALGILEAMMVAT